MAPQLKNSRQDFYCVFQKKIVRVQNVRMLQVFFNCLEKHVFMEHPYLLAKTMENMAVSISMCYSCHANNSPTIIIKTSSECC